MRTNDIVMGAPVSTTDRTPELYLPASKTDPVDIAILPDSVVKRGLCAKSGGKLEVCKTCRSGCKYGAELLRRESMGGGQALSPVEDPKEADHAG